MKLFKKIRETVSRVPKKLFVLLAIALLSVVGIGAVKAEFYPDRPTYDYNKECNANDNDPYDRCGSLNGPVFNSFINTPSYGDERAFVDARKSENTASGSYKNVLEDVTNGSKEVVVRMYIHNNANQSTNASGQGIARNTKVRVFVPTAESQTLRAAGYISADNAALVEDTVDFVGAQAFKVDYVPGSAIIYSNGPVNGQKLSDSIVTTGASIGHDALNGNLPGCFQYEAVVQIRLKVTVKETSALQFTKQVRMAGTKEWKKEVAAKPGDKVEWLLTTKTFGNHDDIIVRDQPAPNTALVNGSVRYINGRGDTVQTDKPLFDGGINAGNYGNNSGFYILFASTVKGDFNECQVRVRNLAYVRSDQHNEIGDDADVIITKENCNPVTPTYSCDLLTASKLSDYRFRFNANTSASNGATLKSLSYNFGDGNTTTTPNASVEHIYATEGTYRIRVTATFTVNGQDKTATSPACETEVTISKKQIDPKYSCDGLTAEKIGDRQYRFTVRFTANNGANLKLVKFNYGDGSQEFVTNNPVANHTYTKDGTFVTRTVLTFAVNGEDKVVDSDKCAAPVTLTSTPPPTTPPTTLPNTGAGSVLGIFAATSLIGAFLHRAFVVRKV